MRVSDRYQALQGCLARHGIVDILAPYKPVVIGTIPLGIDRPDSDVDIACEAPDPAAFEDCVSNHLHEYEGFMMKRKIIRTVETVLCRFSCGGFAFELFAQNVPVEQQYGVRHFRIEKRLLDLKGEEFHMKINKLREGGMKTEPAFATVLRLEGDPYESLLDLENMDDSELMQL